jgi:hypothetical protein
MRGPKVFFFGACLLIVTAPDWAYGQTCVSSIETGITADTVTLHGSAPDLDSIVSGAASAWSGCGMTGIPTISVGSGGSLDYLVTIVNLSSGPLCGITNRDTHEIIIARQYSYNGRQYTCDITNVLAHEVGHLFGLDDSGCTGYLMSSVGLGQTDTRSLRSGECTRANQNVMTTQEKEIIDKEGIRCSTTEGGNGTGCGSPLILDLNGDGINTTPLDWPVQFDFWGDGQGIETSWTDPTTEEAFLFLDLNGNSRVDDGRELFGNATLLPSGETAHHGFEALEIYDDPLVGGNGDGRIAPNDRIWHFLGLWTDRNHNGVSEREEIRPLQTSHVRWLNLDFVESRRFDGNVNWHRYVGSFVGPCGGHDKTCLKEKLLTDLYFHLAN